MSRNLTNGRSKPHFTASNTPMTTNLLDLFNAHCNTRIDAARRRNHMVTAGYLAELRDSLEPLVKKMMEPAPVGDVDAAAKVLCSSFGNGWEECGQGYQQSLRDIATAALIAGCPQLMAELSDTRACFSKFAADGATQAITITQLVAERDALKADLEIVNHYFPEGLNNIKATLAENDTLKKRLALSEARLEQRTNEANLAVNTAELLKKRVEELEAAIHQHQEDISHAAISFEVGNANSNLWKTINQKSGESHIGEPNEMVSTLTVDGKTPGQVFHEGCKVNAWSNQWNNWERVTEEFRESVDAGCAAVLAAFAPKVKPAPSVEKVAEAICDKHSDHSLTYQEKMRRKAQIAIDLLAGTCRDAEARKELADANDKIQALSLRLEEAQAQLAEAIDAEKGVK